MTQQRRRAVVRRIGAALAAVTAGLCALLVPAGPAGAFTVPFTDPYAAGYIGLCSADGKQVTSGSVDDIPFAVRAVASTPTPPGYTVASGVKATLYAYQPVKGIDPADWSGQALTGASYFSNPAHPMAQATVLDYSLKAYLSVYPVLWDGLVELRMDFGAPGKAQYVGSYPASVLRITGTTWQMVRGGPVSCSAGRTKPVEELALPARKFASASASLAARSSAASRAAAVARSDDTVAGGSHGGSAGPSSSDGNAPSNTVNKPDNQSAADSAVGGAHGSAAPAAVSGSPVPAAQTTGGRSTSSSATWLVVAVLAAVSLAAAAFRTIRRRPTGR